MITKELVERINELALKQRTVGLTPDEKEEQGRCRRQYLEAFKSNLKATLDRVKVVTPEEYEAHMAGHDGECRCGCGNPEHGHGPEHKHNHAHSHDGECECKTCKH